MDTGVNRPESIKVYLLKDGELADSVELNEAGGWTYTWVDLAGGFSWSAVEDTVPGYRAEYLTEGNVVTITNYQERAPYDITVKKVSVDMEKYRIFRDYGKERNETKNLYRISLWTPYCNRGYG